jgi:hypothetical protein
MQIEEAGIKTRREKRELKRQAQVELKQLMFL